MSTTTPVRERGPDTATRILEAAEQCIRRYGLRRVSMGDVAQAAGLSRGSVYNHFQDREALIDAVLERAADRFVASSEASVKRRRTLAGQVAEAAAFIRTHGDDPLPHAHRRRRVAARVAAHRARRRARGALGRVLAAVPRRRRSVAARCAPGWTGRARRSGSSACCCRSSSCRRRVVDLDDPDAVRGYVQEFVVRGLAP